MVVGDRGELNLAPLINIKSITITYFGAVMKLLQELELRVELQEENPMIKRLRKEQAAANRAKMAEFKKQQKAAIDAEMKKVKKVSGDIRKEKEKANLNKIGYIIMDAVSSSVPDGDPIDLIAMRLEKMGIRSWDIGPLLDKAVKAHPMLKHYKTYHNYIKEMWQMYIDEYDPEFNDGENPFK